MHGKDVAGHWRLLEEAAVEACAAYVDPIRAAWADTIESSDHNSAAWSEALNVRQLLVVAFGSF